MRFLELRIRNFFSFGPDEEVVDLSNPGLYLVLGENGVGKSCIIDAITFALFGQVTKDIKTINSVVNEQIGANCCVTLMFEVAGDVYWIERYRRDEKYKNEVRLFKAIHDKEGLVSSADSNDTQDEIDKLVRVGFKSLTSAIMMTQEKITGFLEAEAGKKKEIMESILQLDLFVRYHKIAQEKRKLARRKADTMSLVIEESAKTIENYKRSMQEYVASCNALKEADQKRVAEIEAEVAKVDQVNIEREQALLAEATEKKAQIDSVNLAIQLLGERVSSFEGEKRTIDQMVTDYEEQEGEARRHHKKLKIGLESSLGDIHALAKEIKEARTDPAKCPLCRNNINVEEFQSWVDEHERDLAAKRKRYDADEVEVNKAKVTCEAWGPKIADAKDKSSKVAALIAGRSEEIKGKREELKGIVVPKTMDDQELKNLAQKKADLLAKVAELNGKPYVDKAYLDGQMAKYKELAAALDAKRAEAAKMGRKIALYSFWENSFSSKKNSMKSWCISSILSFFNARIKYFIDRFFGGDVEVQMDSELNERLVRKEHERAFGQFSNGQKRRLNLAILFALNSLVKTNTAAKLKIMFLDEILSNFLDDKGISVVLELLEEMKEAGETVYIIDHRDNFRNYGSFRRIDVFLDAHDFSHIKTDAATT